MGCAASTASNDTSQGQGGKKRKNRGNKKDVRSGNRDASDRGDDDESANHAASFDSRKDSTFDEVGVTAVPVHRRRDGDDYDDLSEISTCDLGASLVRATTHSAAIGGVSRGLDKEREETEVDLETEYFVWDDANLDLADMRAKASARKNMAGARNKTILSQVSLGAGGAGGGKGDAKKTTGWVFNDTMIDDVATMDALSESMRGTSMSKRKQQLAAKKEEAAAATSTEKPHHHHADATAATATLSAENVDALKSTESPMARPPRAPKRPPGDIRSFSLSTRIGHSSRVKCLAVAPGEREYVSCSNDDSIITYYDVRGSQELGIYSGHQDTVIHAVFSPCGKFLATTSRDNTLVLWDVVTQKAILTFEHGKVVICCAFSRSSKFIATGCQDKVCRLWECRRGRELVAFTQHEGIIIALSISPDENHVVSASADKTLRIWTVNKGRAKAVLRGHNHIILACNYNAVGDRIVSNDERSVRVWTAPQGALLRTIMVDDLIKLRNPPPNKKQSWTLSCLAPKNFPRHIIVASNNRMVFVVDMETGEEVLSVDTKAPVYCLAPGHRSLVAYGDSFGNVYFLKLEAFDEEEPLDDRPGGADWA